MFKLQLFDQRSKMNLSFSWKVVYHGFPKILNCYIITSFLVEILVFLASLQNCILRLSVSNANESTSLSLLSLHWSCWAVWHLGLKGALCIHEKPDPECNLRKRLRLLMQTVSAHLCCFDQIHSACLDSCLYSRDVAVVTDGSRLTLFSGCWDERM